MIFAFLVSGIAALLLLAATPGTAWAIIPQVYTSLYAHEIAHLFFMSALAVFLYYMLRRRLFRERGWLYICISIAILMLWNAYTFIGHIVETAMPADAFVNRGDFFREQIDLNRAPLYYIFFRVDHLVLIPAMLFFFLGVRWHYIRKRKTMERG